MSNGSEMRASLVVTADAESVVMEGRRATDAWREFRREMGAPVNRPNAPTAVDPSVAMRQEAALQTARANRALVQENEALDRSFRQTASSGGLVETALDQISRSAEDSAQVFSAALDRDEQSMRDLAASLDPAMRAMEEFEAAQLRIAFAVASGVTEQAEAARMLEQLTQRYDAFIASQRRNPDAGSARASAGVFEAGFADRARSDESARIFREFEADLAREAAQSFRALEASINPVIRAERELAAAQAVVNRAVQQGQATNTQAARTMAELENRYEAVVRAQSPAAASAAALERALEEEERAVRQLMLALDPAARAQLEFEQAQERVTRAVRAGLITQEEATRTMGLLEARQRQVGAGGFAMGAGIQNASYQITDFVVQVQAGQAASLALAQQLPQLLGGFGAVGAVAGLVVALGVPLVKFLLDAGDAADGLDDRLKRLDTSLGGVSENLKILRDQDHTATFGNMSSAVRSLAQEMLQLERASELKALRETLDGLMADSFAPSFLERVTALRVQSEVYGAEDFSAAYFSGQRYDAMTLGRGPSYEDFESRRGEIDALAKAGQVKAVIDEIDRLIMDFAVEGPLTDLDEKFTSMLASMGKLAIKTAEVEAQLNLSAQAAQIWSNISENAAGIWDQGVERAKALNAEGEERLRIASNELALAQVIARHGDESVQAEVERDRIARENYEIELARAEIYGLHRDRLLEIFDRHNSVTDATARWADTMAGVRGEIEGIIAAITSIGGGLIDRAAKSAELQALQGGATIADAAARGAEVRRQAQFDQRSAALGGGMFGRAVAGVESWWSAGGDAQDAALAEARADARRREGAARRGGGGGGGSSGLSAISSIKDEIARLKPSYEADIAAAEAWRDKALAALKTGKEGYAEYAADVEAIFQERVAAAYEADLRRRDDWVAGVERATLQLAEDMTSWADFAEDVITRFAQGGEDAFAKFATSGKASIGDLVDFVADAFARLSYQQMIMPGLTTGLNAIIGSIAPGLAPAIGSSLSTNHTGSPGVMRSYAIAGYGDTMRPDERLTMTKRGEEIMTSRALENAGALISSLSALASKSAQPVQVSAPPVQIITNTRVPLEVEEREASSPQGGRQQQFVLSEAVASGLRTRGGAARQTLDRDFNVRQAGIKR
ncbi:phage tail tape measure C-terminal domain-containing protein [Pseudogemmobacter sonorensis]|uniref:phage tail tape measure C-terminal domain-containing protein n=1 Tax=Pseudogemmobacter sonorensis TaxID=2989681 RepID=UPI0036AA2E99